MLILLEYFHSNGFRGEGCFRGVACMLLIRGELAERFSRRLENEIMNRFQIGPEERALSTLFGPDYATYLRGVRRWL